jgi:AraC-like DNA-binding protein
MHFRWKTIFLIFCPLIAAFIICFLTYSPNLVIWPGHKKVGFYSDSLTCDHGNSTIVKLPSDSTQLKFEYILGDKYSFPYVGVTFETDSSSPLYNLSIYDEIILDIEVNKSKRIPIVVNEDLQGYSNPSDALSYRPVTKELECLSGRHVYALELTEFYIPPWWYYNRHITATEAGKINFARIHNIQVHQCELLPKNTKEIFTIHKIFFHKRMEWILFWLGLGLVLYYSIWLGADKLKNTVKRIFPRKEIYLENIADEESQKLLYFLSQNYTDPELSLEKIQQELGISESKISSIIKEHSNQNFKRYLNEIRIGEAKRLLKETDRQVMEIAYNVGYGNISHFNRVFKESEGCSPVEFRKKVKENL